MNNLNLETALLIFQISDKRGQNKLRENSLSFIIKNFDLISKTLIFEEFARKHLDLLLEILKKR